LLETSVAVPVAIAIYALNGLNVAGLLIKIPIRAPVWKGLNDLVLLNMIGILINVLVQTVMYLMMYLFAMLGMIVII